jgi:hypothetical protein
VVGDLKLTRSFRSGKLYKNCQKEANVTLSSLRNTNIQCMVKLFILETKDTDATAILSFHRCKTRDTKSQKKISCMCQCSMSHMDGEDDDDMVFRAQMVTLSVEAYRVSEVVATLLGSRR